ncbi:MAG: hypothetical protein ACK4N5_10665 [Myxococcales bacterium]
MNGLVLTMAAVLLASCATPGMEQPARSGPSDPEAAESAPLVLPDALTSAPRVPANVADAGAPPAGGDETHHHAHPGQAPGDGGAR